MDPASRIEESHGLVDYPRNSLDEKTPAVNGEVHHSPKPPETKAQPGRLGTVGSWLRLDVWGLELLCFFVTLVCFACLFILLGILDKQPLPKWPSGLTLNTAVSWIATVLETTLLLPVGSCISQLCWLWYTKQPRSLADLNAFDEASRGALGSLQLIYRFRGGFLALLGAFITLVALGLDPFFQQTIKYPSRAVASPDSVAQVVFANSYNGQIGQIGGGELSTASDFLPSNLKGAIYSGLWASETLPPPTPLFSCPSGNCTWPLFSTLAANLKCEDITSRVTLNCSQYPGYQTTTCNFISLQDHVLNLTLNGSSERTVMALNSVYPEAVQQYWGYMGNYTGIIGGFQWVKALSHFTSVNPDGGPLLVGPHTTWEAVQCLLYFSVNQLRAHVFAGIYSEEIVDSYAYDGTGPLDPSDLVPLILKPPFAPHQTFNISGLAFTSIVSDTLAVLGTSDQVYTGSSSGYAASFFVNGNDDLILRFWYAQNITRILSNMNVYVTNSLRANSSSLLPPNRDPNKPTIDPATSVNGTVWTPVPFVDVQWAWLAMPLALYALVGVLLFLTVIQSQQRGVGVWKSSPVALLSHAPPGERSRHLLLSTESGAGGDASAKDMEEAAETLKVRLAHDTDGAWRMLPE